MGEMSDGYSVPILPVADVRAALLEYRELGFTAQIGEDEMYGFLRRGGIRLHLYARGPLETSTGPAFCYIFVADADALAREWSATSLADRIQQPRNTGCNMREGVYTDADGNMVRFGSHLPPVA